jgi:hypothetical protein
LHVIEAYYHHFWRTLRTLFFVPDDSYHKVILSSPSVGI